MTGIAAAYQTNGHIRRIKTSRDLLQIADLIALCFEGQLDDDGKAYIHRMRQTAMSKNFSLWLHAGRSPVPLRGYVWEYNGDIVGNLTLIPFYRGNEWIYLIANVAVHPDFRQRGIAHHLTEKAMNNIQQKGGSAVWLHVRSENQVADHLYRSLGFIDKGSRTLWGLPAGQNVVQPIVESPLVIRPREAQDWSAHREWFESNYPRNLAWYMSSESERFGPSVLRKALRFLNGQRMEHWAADYQGELAGMLSWEPNWKHADIFWLTADLNHEDDVITTLVPFASKRYFYRNRRLVINYPAGRGVKALRELHLQEESTLTWMVKNF